MDLKEHYAFDSWKKRNTLEENLFIRNFFLNGNEFPGWNAYRIKPTNSEKFPRTIKSLWQKSRESTDILFRVDVFECKSLSAAHQFLLKTLGEFQSLLIVKEDGIGDIAFTNTNRMVILFARANLVINILNAGRKLMPVDDIASQFDMDLVRKPELGITEGIPEIPQLEIAEKKYYKDIILPMTIKAIDPLNRPLMYKFFSTSGDVLLEENQISYRPILSGLQEISIFIINSDRIAVRGDLIFSIE